MSRHTREALAIGGSILLFIQATVALASAAACMDACRQASTHKAEVPSCHTPKADEPMESCNGTCDPSISTDDVTSVSAATDVVEFHGISLIATLPVVGTDPVAVPVSQSRTYSKGSGPPGIASPLTSHLLRAPPAPRA